MRRQIKNQLGIRLSDEEIRRLQPIIEEIEEKYYQLVPTSELVKELMGLKPYKFLTESHRRRLQNSRN